MRWNYKTFNHTFYNSGINYIVLNEYQKLKQTIIVKELYISNPELKQNEISKPEFLITTSVTTPEIKFVETKEDNLKYKIMVLLGLISLLYLLLRRR